MKRDSAQTLRQWAEFRRLYFPHRPPPSSWEPVTRFVDAAQPHLDEQAQLLDNLLNTWSGRFRMQDPLQADLGVHRWLDRETSYSDWLAWVLERLPASAVFAVLGVQPPFSPDDDGNMTVRRECPLDGRIIDLLVRFKAQPHYAIGIEIKTRDQQYAKQECYRQSLEKRFTEPACVLIAVDEVDEKDRHGFTLRPWKNVAFALRKQIAEFVANNGGADTIVTALMLGFVAAVEQNLLQFPVQRPTARARMSAELTRYLRGEL